jgi:glycosyltransferase involved in cell wall biosynthesis
MRIVYNLRDQNWETTKSLGVLNVSLRILEGLAGLPDIECIDVLANSSLAARLPNSPVARRACRFHGLATAAPSGWSRLIWDHWSVVRQTNTLKPDWLLLPKGFAPLTRWPSTRVSAYVHDNVFGYYNRKNIRPFPIGQSTLFHRMLQRTAKMADSIVTNSQFTASEFRRDFVPRGRVARIGAPGSTGTTPKHHAVSDALLVPTSAWPHKLTAQAITWIGRWIEETGFKDAVHGYGSLPRDCPWPRRERWMHHGRIDDAGLAQLYGSNTTLIYFSDYEGYGLPPVEAAIARQRAIASDLPALRETMPASCLFDNRDYASFHQALSRARTSPPPPPLVEENAATVAERWIAELVAASMTGRP